MKIVTFNLRCNWEEEASPTNSFLHRAGGILFAIRSEQPDVICFQEGTPENEHFLSENLPEYTFVFNQRNSDFGGEGLITALRKETVGLLSLEFFWLSDTPYQPGSRFEIQSPCPRVCQVLLLKNKRNGSLFRVYNNHLDHQSDAARILGIRQVAQRMAEDLKKIPAPYFVLGDFNALPNSETVEYCKNNGQVEMIDLTDRFEATYHEYGRPEKSEKIDYIFVDGETAKKAEPAYLWEYQHAGIFLSDHYPIAVNIPESE